MSKSEGNILLVRKLLENSPGEVIRLALITTHYRQPINWGDDVLNESKKKLDRLYGALRSVTDQIEEGEPSGKVIEALSDDLNTPKALAELFNVARTINSTKDKGEVTSLSASLKSSAKLMGLLQANPDEWFKTSYKDSLTPEEIETLIKQREVARSSDNFVEADEIRDRLLGLGVIIEDRDDGTRWKYLD
jgi:cysteinyl-tRNA synthetase